MNFVKGPNILWDRASSQLIRRGRLAVSKLPIRTASVIEVAAAQREETEKATGEAPQCYWQSWPLLLVISSLHFDTTGTRYLELQLRGFQFRENSPRRETLKIYFEKARPLDESERQRRLLSFARSARKVFIREITRCTMYLYIYKLSINPYKSTIYKHNCLCNLHYLKYICFKEK